MNSMYSSPSPTTVSEHFFNPIVQLLPACQATHACPRLPDEKWLPMALTRVLHDCKSGRGFLQELGTRLPVCPEVGAYFESLKSPRRLRLVAELNAKLQADLSRHASGPLASVPALQEFDLYAGDGHWHGAAVHDPVIDQTKYATGHFYGLNLRTRGLVHLTVDDKKARRKEHDMRALKRLDWRVLRQGAPKGRKVIWVWDKAGIDFQQWHRWKENWGIYFISCAKENMTLEVIGQRPFDRKDPANTGVTADDLVATSQGVAVRRITYVDPVDGEHYVLLTTEFSLAPGWIVHLYRLRWNIEKTFDELKNKLSEKKSWATDPIAKQVQAQLLCLAHNLLQLFEQIVLVPAGVENRAEDERREKRLARTKAFVKKRGVAWPKLLESLLTCTQHSLKFIRWLRAHFFSPASCCQALDALRALYAKL